MFYRGMKTKYCDNEHCKSEAVKTAPVSVRRVGDSNRKFCVACYEAFVIGVQHGRLSENSKAYSKRQFALAD
jgi:hypothetical protein